MTTRPLGRAGNAGPMLRMAAVVAGVVATCSVSAQQQSGAGRAGTRTITVGPAPGQRASSEAVIDRPFATRADEDLAGARIDISFAADGEPGAPDVARVAVFVNDERVATFDVEPRAERTATVNPELLGARNMLSVRLLDRSGRLVAGHRAWSRIAAVRLHLDTTPSPLPDDLALLPLPFIDQDVDTEASVPLVLPGPATPERIRAAALVASWMALGARIPVSFSVGIDTVPDGRAVVLVDGVGQPERLGLAPLEGPLVRMVDAPSRPGSNAKLLVVGGRTPAELRVAAESLALRSEHLVGREVRLRPAAPGTPTPPYSAPRWLPSGRAVAFREFPLGGTPSHEGATSATLPIRFRIAPDLAIWPADFVTLDLRWTERVPPGVLPPRLDLEMNGYFLATLPAATRPGETTRTVRMRIPRQHVRGFNELLVHVHYAETPDGRAGAIPTGGGAGARVAISGASVIHLEGLAHFAALPDMGLFVYDGYPFTRVPDLRETAIVLPQRPDTSEISAVVTLMAQFAQVTGRAGTRASFVAGEVADEALAGKDLLVVGTERDAPLIARWREEWPLSLRGRRARVQSTRLSRSWLELTGGLGRLLDRRRADAVLQRGGDIGVVMGIESPLSPGRTAIAITSTAAATVPPARQFLGYAETRSLTADDVLILTGGRRWMFRVGPSFENGRLAPWNELRWFLATHWLLLMPVLVLGVAVLGLQVSHAVAAHMRERLAWTEGEP